jgi:hypothetical protein
LENSYEYYLKEFGVNLEEAICGVFSKYTKGAKHENGMQIAERMMSRYRGVFVASLCGEIEESTGKNIRQLIDQTSEQATVKNSIYRRLDTPKGSSLRGRLRVMWAIRIAFTHGNGMLSQISDDSVKEWLNPAFSAKHFHGVDVENGKIELTSDITDPAIFSAIEVIDNFKRRR